MPNLLRQALSSVPPETKAWISKSFDITDQILDVLERRGITQRAFAGLMGKSESEISKWMKGTHNFTEETIAKIEIALGERITVTTKQVDEKIRTLNETIEEKNRQIRGLAKILKEKGIDPGEYGYALGA
ncbi:MAG: helix-turn-helix transcriptional regulator [Pseudomonadota bacterium]